jgi:hypothetical protein
VKILSYGSEKKRGLFCAFLLDFNRFEAPVGFEPTNKGFADLPLKPLGYSAIKKIKELSAGRIRPD